MELNIKLINQITLAFVVLLSTHVMAADMPAKHQLFLDIKFQALSCNNNNCSNFKLLSPSEAQILIAGDWLTATIAESSESDGGDLDDLTIVNSKGQAVARKSNIASYGNVLGALTGNPIL
jgi:hypothetical protein